MYIYETGRGVRLRIFTPAAANNLILIAYEYN
jgi:hypothetical protein